jgi:uncharacterized protein YdaU (DUF1376 family)
MSRVDAWMPLYIGDYLSDTMHLTCEQSGAYLHLIMHYWRAGALPDNDTLLAQVTKLSAKAWKSHRAIIESFFTVEGGQWKHKRIETERSRAQATAERYHERAKKAAEARHKDASSNATSNGQACSKHRNSQSQSHSSIELNESTNVDSSAEADPPLTQDEILEAWQVRMVPQGFPPVRKMTSQRTRQLKARLKDSTFEEWQQAMSALERSAFCRGENDRGWRADFDFLLQPKSFTKLLEGAYDH